MTIQCLKGGPAAPQVHPTRTPQRPRCRRTSSPRPRPPPTCWCAGSRRRNATGTSPTTWCCGSAWRRTATSTSTTTATAVRAGVRRGPRGWAPGGGRCGSNCFPPRRRRRTRPAAAHQQQRPPLRPRRRRTRGGDGARLLPLPAPASGAGPAAAGGARGLVPEEVRKLPAQRHHHPQVRSGRGRAGWRAGPARGAGWAGLEAERCRRWGGSRGRDRALPGLPRSPWKVTSINKSPQR